MSVDILIQHAESINTRTEGFDMTRKSSGIDNPKREICSTYIFFFSGQATPRALREDEGARSALCGRLAPLALRA